MCNIGYLHIDNLYKNELILSFRKCYALEKIDGTSAHISYKKGKISFFSGGEKHQRFVELFNEEKLTELFSAMQQEAIIIFGEAYGGKMQGMKETYGSDLKFIAFDVKIENSWLNVLKAEAVVKELGLEFVHYDFIPTDLSFLDKERDADSIQAIRNGIGSGKKREGIVLRPPFEVKLNNGERVIAKHKRDDFRETKTKRVVGKNLEVLTEARAIAEEWVTPMRLSHILQKLPEATSIEHTKDVINAMVKDILREAKNEIVESKEAKKAISSATAKMWKELLKKRLYKGEIL